MGVEYAPASLSLTHDSTELYCTCTYARGLSVRVAQDGVMVPVMVHVMVQPHGDDIVAVECNLCACWDLGSNTRELSVAMCDIHASWDWLE